MPKAKLLCSATSSFAHGRPGPQGGRRGHSMCCSPRSPADVRREAWGSHGAAGCSGDGHQVGAPAVHAARTFRTRVGPADPRTHVGRWLRKCICSSFRTLADSTFGPVPRTICLNSEPYRRPLSFSPGEMVVRHAFRWWLRDFRAPP